MPKQSRHFAIREIISGKSVASQDELRIELKKKGFDVTQATLSRDLKDLGVGRVAFGEGMKYVLQPAAEAQILKPLVGAQVLSINANESMVVIHTLPGSANVIGEFLDALNNGGIIGTIAGDNTLLVIPKSQRQTAHVVKFLREKLITGYR
jgi:transcriptional regulator of arginine metabolism